MTKTELYRYLKKHGSRLLLNEVDGRMWWSNAYVIAPVDVAMTELLALYNLTPEPMNCDVDSTIVRNDTDPVNMASLLAKFQAKNSKTYATVKPLQVGETTLLTSTATTAGTGLCELWSTDGATVTHRFLADHLKVVLSAGGDHMVSIADKPKGPTARFGEDGLAGLLMPVYGEAQVLPWAKAAA